MRRAPAGSRSVGRTGRSHVAARFARSVPGRALGPVSRALLASSCVLAGCEGGEAGSDHASAERDPAAEAVPPAPSLGAYLATVRDRASTRAGLREAFGEPDGIRARPFPNRHVAGQIDTVYRFVYPGAVIGVYAVTGGGDLFASAEISANRFLPLQPRIGTAVDSVLAWFGTPDRRATAELEYRFGEAESRVVFEVADGLVRRVLLFPYLD